MKKTFWGYSIQEVDDNISYLESQNIKLERQVKQLSSELEKAKTELENAPSNSDISSEITDVSEKDRLISELQQKLIELNKENQELVLKSDALKSKINELSADDTSKEQVTFDDIGNICKIAYTDMHVTKQKTKERIAAFLERFWQEWTIYEKQLSELYEQMKLRQQERKNSFISYADCILQVYGDMENSNRELDNNLSEIIDRKAKIEEGLTSLLAELDGDFDDEGDLSDGSADSVKKENEPKTDEDKKYSILDTIKIMSKKHQNQESSTADNSSQSQATAVKAVPTTETTQSDVPKDEMNISQKVNIRNII